MMSITPAHPRMRAEAPARAAPPPPWWPSLDTPRRGAPTIMESQRGPPILLHRMSG